MSLILDPVADVDVSVWLNQAAKTVTFTQLNFPIVGLETFINATISVDHLQVSLRKTTIRGLTREDIIIVILEFLSVHNICYRTLACNLLDLLLAQSQLTNLLLLQDHSSLTRDGNL